MNRVKTLLLTVTVLMLVTSLFAGQEVIPYRGVAKEGPNHSQMTRDTDVVMTNVDGITLNSNFGGWTKDYFLEYYMPAADGYVNSITFNMSDLPDVTGGGMAIWIYEANYPWDEINTFDVADACGDAQLGYYDESTGYENVGTNWVRGGINDIDGALDYDYDPLGMQIWPEFGAGSISVEPNADDEGFITADLVALDGEPAYFERGVPIIVVVKFTGFPDGGDATEYRMGFLSGVKHIEPQPTMKFYSTISSPSGRCGLGADWGWYIRSYVWDWDLNATLTGDRGPVVAMENLITTLSTDAQTVTATITDDNPSGGAAGVASASVFYEINGGAAMEVTMTGTGDTYTADIPGQVPGTEIKHWVEATDVGGITTVGEANIYSIFEALNPILFNYDTDELAVGTAAYYYNVTHADTFQHFDVWEAKFGPVTAELVDKYEIIYHVMGAGPYNDATTYSTVYGDWLGAGTAENPHRLFISGQDYGVISGFADTTFPAEAFENMYLGVETLGPQDINYDGTEASYEGPYAIDAVANDPLVGHLAAFEGDSLQLFYWPFDMIGANNWIDNLTPSTGTVAFTDPNQEDAAVAVYNEGTGWKTAFWTFDALSLEYYSPADTASMYWWGLNVGSGVTSATFDWFGAPTTPVGIDNAELSVPDAHNLSEAYPNPFNPVTNIAYELGNAADVNITVYNMLGQEIATLVAGFQTAGAYTVQWNGLDKAGHSVPSGLYFYTMQTEGFSATQKMMLLK